MTRHLWRAAAMAAVMLSLCVSAERAGAADCGYPPNSQDLFYNFYVGPGGGSPCSGGVPAQMYPSPRPTPPLVGHTYVTYQPLLPHEFLYVHHRKYVNHLPDGGVTRTHVAWTWWHW